MTGKVFLRAIRIHQWVKNLLLLVPLVTAHRYMESHYIVPALLAFLSFGCCASAVYLINDMMDIEADKQHVRKRSRPIASGEMSLTFARFTIVMLLGIATIVASLISVDYMMILGCYLLITSAYTFYLKRLVLIDIIVLAMLYTVRVFAGGVATELQVSQWLICFSLFFFVSLACVKRFSELRNLKSDDRIKAVGRGYIVADLEQISQFGLSAGCVAVLVFAFYITSAEVTLIYRSPKLLWMMCPLLLYWVSRLWLLAHRGKVHDDPIVFAIRDSTSYVVGFLALALLMLAA